jgi:aminoglycoside 6'-N-acetyltransferase
MRTTAEAREFLSGVLSGWAARRPAWFVEDVATGQVVGAVIADCDRAEVELSYVVARTWSRRGHATAAVRLIAEGAFSDPAVERVRAYCDAGHAAPARVLEKAGFRRQPGLAELNDCVCYVRNRPR